MRATDGHVLDPFGQATYAKVRRRLLPFLFLLYVVAYLDRVNISYAHLQMSGDLKFSEAIYGFGAGLFFIGYFLFEVPSNLLLERVGARLWIARILLVWGVVASAFALVRTPTQFYALRFLLGVSEAGFFPGIILYLTYWFPSAMRARTVSGFMTAIAASGVIGGPLSGWIMRNLAGVGRLAGWQWVFLIEGLPAVLLGAITLLYLENGPPQASWLSEEERRFIVRELDDDRRLRIDAGGHRDLFRAFKDANLWALAIFAFCINFGNYGLGFFLPRLLQGAGVADPVWNGLLAAVPFAVGAIAMVVNGWHSDRTSERRWHVSVPAIVAAIGLIITGAAGTDRLVMTMVGLTLATAGTLAALSVFWSIPASFFAASSAAAGIAVLNSLGSIGGFVGPSLVGIAIALTHSSTRALYVLAASLGACAFLIFAVPRHLAAVAKPQLARDDHPSLTPSSA